MVSRPLFAVAVAVVVAVADMTSGSNKLRPQLTGLRMLGRAVVPEIAEIKVAFSQKSRRNGYGEGAGAGEGVRQIWSQPGRNNSVVT